jgi:asparagine synthase (glutamine-hydrolysing)
LISRLARQHVTVALSGDGGDEVFGGYHRYRYGSALWRAAGWLPRPARAGMASLLFAGERPRKVAALLPAANPSELYWRFRASRLDGAGAVLGSPRLPTFGGGTEIEDGTGDLNGHRSTAELMMYLDQASYLPDDILVKVDRASMGVSLEARAPYLDHRVVEFAWSLPPRLRINDGQGKWLLRRVLDRHVPRALIERPKKGFSIPIGSWLRGELRSWADDLLAESALRADGFLDPGTIRTWWSRHLAGSAAEERLIWNALMFQAWWAEQRASAGPRRHEEDGHASATVAQAAD